MTGDGMRIRGNPVSSSTEINGDLFEERFDRRR